jgi:hypothetical protein
LPDRLQFAEYGHRDFYKVRAVLFVVLLFVAALCLYCDETKAFLFTLYSSGPPG